MNRSYNRTGATIATWLLRKLVDEDEARVRTVIVRMHMLKKRYPKLVIVPAHDARVWATLPTVVRR